MTINVINQFITVFVNIYSFNAPRMLSLH